jgi:hypothetical protein
MGDRPLLQPRPDRRSIWSRGTRTPDLLGAIQAAILAEFGLSAGHFCLQRWGQGRAILAQFPPIPAGIGPKDALLGPILSSAGSARGSQQFGAFELDGGAGRGWAGAMTATPTRPPSMSSTVPCTNAASSLARSTAACAMSSGVPALLPLWSVVAVVGARPDGALAGRARRRGFETLARQRSSGATSDAHGRSAAPCRRRNEKRGTAGQHYADEDCPAGFHALGVMRLSQCREDGRGDSRDDGRTIHEATRRWTR